MCGFFIFRDPGFWAVFLFQKTGGYMQLELIHNPDETQIVIYKIARVLYAETYAPTLPAVEALASMIKNIMTQQNRCAIDVVSDETIFNSLCTESARHKYLSVDANNRAFQMCLRVARRMMFGDWVDTCFGAVCFHHADEMPDWATARGYIADIDGLLFYTAGDDNEN